MTDKEARQKIRDLGSAVKILKVQLKQTDEWHLDYIQDLIDKTKSIAKYLQINFERRPSIPETVVAVKKKAVKP